MARFCAIRPRTQGKQNAENEIPIHDKGLHAGREARVNVIMLTVFLGLMLVSFFICFFLHQHAGSRHAAGERDALLPLQEEKNSTAISHKAKVHPINDPL